MTVVGGRDIRLALAESIGASRTINYHKAGDFAAGVRQAAGRSSWPLIVESSGSAAALESTLALGDKEARILVLGDYGQVRSGFPWNTLLHRELHLIGSNTGSGAWREAVRIAGSLPLAPLITHRLPATEFTAALNIVRDRASGSVKVVMEWK